MQTCGIQMNIPVTALNQPSRVGRGTDNRKHLECLWRRRRLGRAQFLNKKAWKVKSR